MLDRSWAARVVSCGSFALACATAAACGGDDDGGQPTDAARVDARIIDARIVDAPVDADLSACAIDGVYQTTIGGPAFFRFDADTHAWGIAPTEADLGNPFIFGTYTFAGTTFTIVESPDSECPVDQVGTYSVAFAGACDFTLTLVSEPCTQRGDALHGAVFTFLHL